MKVGIPPKAPGGRATALLAAVAAVLIAAPARGAEKAAVARSGEGGPTLLKRASADAPWQLVTDGEALAAGTRVLGGLGASVESPNGAVRAAMPGNVAGLSPFPILETGLVLGDPGDADLAVTMDRGRLDLINQKKSGAARVKLTIRDKTGEIVLREPGGRAVIEIYGRWPKGSKFVKNPKEPAAPALAILAVAAKGDVEIKGPKRTLTLKAPPGPALLLVDDIADDRPEVDEIDKLPDWIDALDPAAVAKVKAAAAKFRAAAGKKSVGEALDELVVSDDPAARRLAVILMGATDDLKRLGAALAATKHADVWDNGVVVLRAWLGRAPGQDQKLFRALSADPKLGETGAATVVQLLHSFGDEDLKRAETYEALIHFLDADHLALRGLAHWHLVRLVPEGRKITYDPTGPAAQRQKAVKEWHDLVPHGTVPGKSKSKANP